MEYITCYKYMGKYKYNIKVILNDHIKGQAFIKRDSVKISQPVFLQLHPFASNI